MAQEAYDVTPQEGINAAFLRNHRGEVCITFADPVYVRADAICVDSRSLSVHAMIHNSQFLIGYVSEPMMAAFVKNKRALLTALRPDGMILELYVPVKEGKV